MTSSLLRTTTAHRRSPGQHQGPQRRRPRSLAVALLSALLAPSAASAEPPPHSTAPHFTAPGPSAVSPPGEGGVPTEAPAPAPVLGQWPLAPRPAVAAHFDPPSVRWGSGHRGVDLVGTAGQSVHAARAGTVTFAGPLAGRGVIVVSHGETRTTYEPVTATVPVGSAVAAGAVLGTLSASPSHCAPTACLHWGWRRGEVYLDPLTMVGAQRVRLLPWSGAPAGSLGPAGTGLWQGADLGRATVGSGLRAGAAAGRHLLAR